MFTTKVNDLKEGDNLETCQIRAQYNVFASEHGISERCIFGSKKRASKEHGFQFPKNSFFSDRARYIRPWPK